MKGDTFTRLLCSRMSIRALVRLPFKPCAHMRIPGARLMELCACITRAISEKRFWILMGALNASM